MFIISLTYKVPLEAVDAHIDAHVAWLKKGYADGLCVASGRKNPRTGGVVLAKGTKDQVEALYKSDPFFIHGVADYEVTEVAFSMVAEGLEGLRD